MILDDLLKHAVPPYLISWITSTVISNEYTVTFLKYYFYVWVWNLVCQPKERILIEVMWETSAEVNIFIQERDSNMGIKKTT